MNLKTDNRQNAFDLTAPYTDKEQLITIANWYSSNVSKDIRFIGTPEEQYHQYIEAIVVFLQLADKLDLFAAIEHGYDQWILAQLFSPTILNQPDALGMYPLHLAALAGYPCTTEVLLSQGANPKQSNKKKQLPIHCALFMPLLAPKDALQKKESIANLLFEYAPETLLVADNRGNTPCHYMAINGFDVLLKSLLDNDPQGAFHHNHVHHYPIHQAILNNHFDIALYLLNIKNVSTLTDSQKRAAIHYAASYGSLSMLEACARYTEDLNTIDTNGKTPLILAAEYKNLDAVKFLIDAGVCLHLRDSSGKKAKDYCHDTEAEAWFGPNHSAKPF